MDFVERFLHKYKFSPMQRQEVLKNARFSISYLYDFVYCINCEMGMMCFLDCHKCTSVHSTMKLYYYDEQSILLLTICIE